METRCRYWSICEHEFLRALHRVAAGEDPDLVYTEMYVNSEHESV